MKKLSVPCVLGSDRIMIDVFVGDPYEESHPLHYQNAWISKEKGGQIAHEVMDAFAELMKLAKKNNVTVEELCQYAEFEKERQQSGG